jgi:hypothetical protein
MIHSWGLNAPPFTLPEGSSIAYDRAEWLTKFVFDVDASFPVGRNTPYKYLILNIHYGPIVKNDSSGNQIIFSRKPSGPICSMMENCQ